MTIMSLPLPSAGPAAFLAALQDTDWSAFTPTRDLPPLRAALAELEQDCGITEAHRFATERIKTAGAILRHPDGHPEEVCGFELSPCGRYLAVGSGCGDDYDRGGVLQIWELATARCVNVIDGVTGGVGWRDHTRTIQWSADGQRIALAFDTNGVGTWDPFGAEVEPIGKAFVTHGSSRPPSFAFAPDGTRAYIVAGSPNEVGGCIAPLTDGLVDDDDEGVTFLAETLPESVRTLLGRELRPRRVFWSQDGTRLYGHEHRLACAIDVRSGQVSWVTEAGTGEGAPVWSQDERFFAHVLNERLVINDAVTGQPIATLSGHPGASELSWGAHGATTRLGVVVPGRKRIRPRVAVYDDGRHRYDIDVALKQVDREYVDGTVWAWSPDGLHAAGLTASGHVEIWQLGDEPCRLRIVEAPEHAYGVLWGAEGVIVIPGSTTLRFIQAAAGEITGDFTFMRVPSGPRPLELNGHDVGEEFREEEEADVDPTFALDDQHWATAFESGPVIAPPGSRDALDGVLAWTVDRRFGWPLRWGELHVVPDAATAVEHVSSPLAQYLEPFRGRTEAVSGTEEWPPPNTATLDDLFDAAITSVGPLHEGWDHHVSEYLRHAARLRARRGELTGATRLLEAIPAADERVRGRAEVAMITAAAGRIDAARAFFDSAEADVEAVLNAYNVALVASSVAGAYAALGDPRANAWFDRARAAIEPEANSGQHRLAIVWALIESGRIDDARSLWRARANTPSIFSSVPFLAYLIRTGRDHLAKELISMRGREGEGSGWFDGWEAVEVFVDLGRPDLLREWAQNFGERYAYQESLAQAETNARLELASRPTQADLAALTDAYATLRKTPRTRREDPTGQLILQAAACGHIGAVLDLIPSLPANDFNGRAGHAFRALWLAATRIRVKPW
jgi:WD40 repeat protein